MKTMDSKKRNSLNNLSPLQVKALMDIKDFLNLKAEQILEHIYSGNAALFNREIKYLVGKEILAKMVPYRAYCISKTGSWLVSALSGDTSICNRLIHSEFADLRRDMLVYSAFKHLEKRLKEAGNTVTSYRTARQLKAEDTKIFGGMRPVYPSLYIEYVNESTGAKGCVNLMLCLGGKTVEILNKAALPNLVWYTNRESRRDRIARLVYSDDVNIVRK
jgi:hypothetical protein